MAASISERLVKALVKRGCGEIPTVGSRQFRTLVRPSGAPPYYFVGKSGALRFGEEASRSIRSSRFVRAKLLEDI